MSIPFFANQVEESKTWVFAQNLNNGLASAASKSWNALINNLSFVPDYCIVRQITYTQALVNNTTTTPQSYIIYSTMSGNIDFLGCFNSPSIPTNLGAGVVGSAGSTCNPNTVIKISKPIQSVQFQLLQPSNQADDTMVQATDCTGNLCILVEFVKLKSK